MATTTQYQMHVYSNPTEGMDAEYLDWYAGQHIHDLLRIPGFTGCRFYELAATQLGQEDQKYRYLMVWDIETDDLSSVMDDVAARMKDGRTVFSASFDTAYFDCTVTPITKYVTSAEISGQDPAQVLVTAELTASE